jgi:ABC-2 type transport system permease protein
VIAASLYIIVCSARNRIRVRLRRLREPRYLFGAIAGAAYFYFTIFARMRTGRGPSGRRRSSSAPPPELMTALTASGPAVVGLLLMALTAIGSLLPMTSSLLVFSEPEIQFLFPAPVSRRQLLLHRMMRSQLGILFGVLIFSLFFPASSGYGRLQTAVAMWLLFATGKIYFAGMSLARTRLASAASSARRAAWVPLLALAAAASIVGAALGRAFLARPVESAGDALTRLSEVTSSAPVRIALLPFVALARPLFAPSPSAFALTLVPAVLVLAATALWVVHTDEGFEEAASQASARQAAARQAQIAPAPTARATNWRLGLTGPTEGVFLWKNALQVVRATTGVALIRYLVPLTIIAVSISAGVMSSRRAVGTAMTLCSIAVWIAAFTAVLGPQIMRTDLRDDLRHLELLKTWPLKASAVIRGEMLFPGAALTAMAWLALTCAAILSAAGFPRLSLGWRLSGAVSALMLAPALIFAQLTVHNAAAVLFPAWVPLGTSRPRGLDAMGQRLILLGAVLLALLVMLAPGVLAGAILWFAFYRFIGPAVLIPGAMICLGIVLLEVLAATEALGPAYDQLDALSIERPE